MSGGTHEAPGRTWRTSELHARRVWDHIRTAQLQAGVEELIARRFIAIRLEDAHCDGVIYDSRDDAVRHQSSDPNLYAYVQLPLETWSVSTCDVLLWYWRGVYAQGYRPASSHEGAHLILPLKQEDLR